MTLGNKPVLAIRPKEKPYGPPFFLTNLKIDSGDTDNVQTTFHVRANFIGRGLDASDEYRTDVYLGSRREVRWEWYRPLPYRPLFVMPSAYTRKIERGIYLPAIAGASFATDETAVGVDLGVDLGRSSQLRLGERVGKRSYTPRGVPLLPNDRGNIVATTLRYVYDNQDDPIVPRAGLYSVLHGEWYQKAPASPDGYGQVSAEGWHAFPLSRRETIHAALSAGEQTSGRTPIAEQFVLGGPFRLASAFNGELRGQRYRFGTLGYVRQMTPRFALLGGAFYLGGWYEQGMVESAGQHTSRRDIHLAAFAPTLVGPIVLGAGIGDAGKKRIYVRFGRLY